MRHWFPHCVVTSLLAVVFATPLSAQDWQFNIECDLALVGDGLRELLAGFPLHERQQFGRFHREGDCELLRRMELAPVALVAMAEDALG